MFEGFNESTIEYYRAIGRSNCKDTNKENQVMYLEGVKYPLEIKAYNLHLDCATFWTNSPMKK